MKSAKDNDNKDSRLRVEQTYRREKPRFLSRLRAAGRSLEEAEDILHDVYVETVERISLVAGVINLPAWINSLLGRRMIDAWRRDRVRAAAGETKIAEETLREIICAVGLDPQDQLVRACLLDALDDALKALPPKQRQVVEAQVFGGMSFKEISEATGESIDTLCARKRYALGRLSAALRHWIDE